MQNSCLKTSAWWSRGSHFVESGYPSLRFPNMVKVNIHEHWTRVTRFNPLWVSGSTQSTYNKPEQQNIKVIVLVIIFGHKFQWHSLQNKHSRSCILITASDWEKLTSHFLATWSVYTVHETVIFMSKCLHGHWPWSTFAHELYMRRKLMGQRLNVYYSIKQ